MCSQTTTYPKSTTYGTLYNRLLYSKTVIYSNGQNKQSLEEHLTLICDLDLRAGGKKVSK